MNIGQRKAVPPWEIKLEQARNRIHEILLDHPLAEIETNMLAYYAEQCLTARGNEIRSTAHDYKTIVSWLECTSRISPREEKELLSVLERKP